MFKARKSRINFSQRSSQSNNENTNQNVPVAAQPKRTASIFDDDDDDDIGSVVPPSQGPSQTLHEIRSQRSQARRFLTQRSNARYTSMSQQISQSSRIAKTYFESLLMKAGCKIDEEAYILDCDIFAFQNRLDDNLHIAENYPSNVNILLADIKNLLVQSEEQWRKLMTAVHFTLHSNDIESLQSQVHESSDSSLMRLLLLNNDLQKGVLEILFNELKSRAKSEDDLDIQNFDLIVGQMQYLSYSKDNSNYIFEQFFDVLAECSVQTRDELIKVTDDLIEPARHSDTINRIIGMISTADQLFTSKNLATFEGLRLNTSTMKKLRNKIVDFIKDEAPKTLYVDLLNFMTRFNQDEQENYYEIIEQMRNCVDWKVTDPRVQDKLYDFIKRSISRCHLTRDSWVRTVQMIENARSHKVVDIFALLVIARRNDDKIQIIENLFKKKTKARIFTVELLQETIKHLNSVLADYVHVLTDIFEVCFKERDPYTQFFASLGFRMIFKIKNGDRHYIVSRLVAIICTRPVDLPFLADNDIRSNALMVLLEIKKRLDNESRGAFYKVDRILDYSHNLTIDQYRVVTKILCSLAFEGGGDPSLQNEFNIRARKDVTDIYLFTKLQGIISICQIVNYTAWMLKKEDESSMCSENTVDTISQIPPGTGHECADLLRLALNSSQLYVDALMLYYDELALVFSPRNRDLGYVVEETTFLGWISQSLEKSLEEIFVVDQCPEARGVKFEYFYNINFPMSDSESQAIKEEALQLAVNIGGIALSHNEREEPRKAIHVLCPLLNALYNILYRKYGTNLEYINALLGCAIVLPSSFKNEDKFLEDHERQALDIYFFTANWFRSVISAFASQQSPMLRRKVLMRINQLIEIEASIKYMLLKGPATYESPACSYRSMEDMKFINPKNPKKSAQLQRNTDIDTMRPPQTLKRGKKRKLTDPKDTNTEPITQFDEEQMNLNATTGNLPVVTQFTLSQGMQSAEIVKYRSMLWLSYSTKEKYRQLDSDIMLLLEEPLEIKFPVPEQDIGQCLHLQELKFILTDLISKLESLAGVKKFRAEQQLQILISPVNFINELIVSLKHIMRFFMQLTTYIQEKIDESEDNMLLLYSAEVNHAKICVGCCLHLMAALLSWPGFCIDDHYGILFKALNLMLERDHNSNDTTLDFSSDQIIRDAAEEVMTKMVKYETVILDLRSAVHLVHLVKALSNFCDKTEMVAELAKNLLTKKWFSLEGNTEQGKNTNLLLHELLKCYLRNMELDEVEQLVETLGDEMITLKAKDNYMSTFPNFNKANFSIFYRCLLNTCEDAMKRNANVTLPTDGLLDVWKQCFDILRAMLAINEKNPVMRNTSSFLKYSHSIVNLFRKTGIKAMTKMMNHNAEKVQSLLSAMQKTTRFLHNLSCHTKNSANNQIIRQIPGLRSTMEKLVHEVKSVLANNHALSSFWLGNLKNKDIHGVELLSQMTPENDESDHDNDDDGDDANSPSNSSDEDEPEEVVPEISPNLTRSSSSVSKIFD